MSLSAYRGDTLAPSSCTAFRCSTAASASSLYASWEELGSGAETPPGMDTRASSSSAGAAAKGSSPPAEASSSSTMVSLATAPPVARKRTRRRRRRTLKARAPARISEWTDGGARSTVSDCPNTHTKVVSRKMRTCGA
eukprot:30237-Pelagococcus_subviridis.AAC.6